MQYIEYNGQPFLFIDENAEEFALPPEKVEVDLTMRYKIENDYIDCRFFNKDGSEAKLCGNALFAFMKHFKGNHLFLNHYDYVFLINYVIFNGSNTGKELLLQMKKAKFIMHSNLNELGEMWQVDVGNKHEIVLFDETFQNSVHKRFLPHKSEVFNLHLVTQENKNTFEVRCFERGVGETQSCGSGAYAVGSAMMKHFNLDEVNIVMKGGRYIVKDQTLISKI